MRINILKRIDLEELDKEINIAEDCFKNTPYLIMNKYTKRAINEECDRRRMSTTYISRPLDVATYKGCPIAICDMLEFGEVDIR